jgi:hypothetical protein
MGHGADSLVAFGATVILGFGVIPVWIAAGLADYVCHRAARIEDTAGLTESLLHLVQFALVGIPLTAALFLEPDAMLLVLIALFVVLHHVVAFVDVRYANSNRAVSPIEQMIHSFLEMLPVMAFLTLCALHFGQIQALFDLRSGNADFGLHMRSQPLPAWYIVGVITAAVLIDLLPYAEELIRCLSAAKRQR